MIDLIVKAGGNTGSVRRFLERIEVKFRIVETAADLSWQNPLLIPGVGSFGAVMQKLNEGGFSELIKEISFSGVPVLGICSGMQILFDSSEESPGVKGLGLIPGKVIRFKEGKIPNTGWSKLQTSGEYVYFVNSYHAETEFVSDTALQNDLPFPAVVTRGSVTGFQFHPEKSHRHGEVLLRRWINGL